jgi:hypothetical protein
LRPKLISNVCKPAALSPKVSRAAVGQHITPCRN